MEARRRCPHCGARDLPAQFDFCGRCGKRLDSTPITDATIVNDILAQAPQAMEALENHGIRICGGCIVLLNGSVRQTAEYSGLSPAETSALIVELNEKASEQQHAS